MYYTGSSLFTSSVKSILKSILKNLQTVVGCFSGGWSCIMAETIVFTNLVTTSFKNWYNDTRSSINISIKHNITVKQSSLFYIYIIP